MMAGMEPLTRIRRLVAAGQYRLTVKAEHELDADGLIPQDAIEAILNAQSIKKTLRSRSAVRGHSGEKLYVIESFNYTVTLIDTKGATKREEGQEIFYLFISSIISTLGDDA